MRRLFILCAAAIACLALAAPGALAKRPPFKHIDHFVVIYLENHSFDNLYGGFAGANGLSNADPAHTLQVDFSGHALKCLEQNDPQLTSPPLPADACSVANGDPFNSHFGNAPFSIDTYVPPDKKTRDLVHRYYQNQVQIDGGRNDKFAIASDAKGLSMGVYDTANLPLAQYAQRYTLADNFFQGAFGGSFLNHQWLIAARTPEFANAPKDGSTCDIHSVLDANGMPVAGKDLPLTTVQHGDWAVNTIQPVNPPFAAGTPDCRRLPPLNYATIGDRLSAAGLDWAWYAGGWDDAAAGHPDPLFQFHHQPFAYFTKYAPGAPGRSHLRDESEFLAAARAGELPAVSFVKPVGEENEHPGYADLSSGELHAADLIEAVRQSNDWKDTAVIVTYDENGGFWDHAAPPVVDRWGPGTRVPTLVISPRARRHFVDHESYDTTSILATIERRYGLAPLSPRDAAANDLRHAFRRSEDGH
ncbi:MAG TPA: acid phosphatase [Thermoleophilaceae bacterium]